MSSPKSSPKSSKKSKRAPMNKALYIRSFDPSKSAKQIVEEAKKVGIRFTDKYVHSIRRMAREHEAKLRREKLAAKNGVASAAGIAGLSAGALAAVASASSQGDAAVELLVLGRKALEQSIAARQKAIVAIDQTLAVLTPTKSAKSA